MKNDNIANSKSLTILFAIHIKKPSPVLEYGGGFSKSIHLMQNNPQQTVTINVRRET